MQGPEGLLYQIRELELDKKNNQALNSLRDFSFHILQTFLLTYIGKFI